MTWTEAEIESIVQRVVQRLRASTSSGEPSTSSNSIHTSTPNDGTGGDIRSPNDSGVLHVSDRLITLSKVQALDASVRTLSLSTKAILTPAAADWLRAKKIGWSKSDNLASPSEKKKFAFGPIVVCGSTPLQAPLAKTVCPKIAQVLACDIDDTSALRNCQNQMRHGKSMGILVVQAAHATCWQAARDEKLRAAVVSNWEALEKILREVPANLLIFGKNDWNAPGIANSIRRLHRSLNQGVQ